MATEHPETLMAESVGNYLGRVGYWLVSVAAVLSTLSALAANLLAASRVALSMARDRTLPVVLARLSPERRTPAGAVVASALTLVAILIMVPDLASAGAAASLIFLVSFALVHLTAYLARRRGGGAPDAYQTPWFPVLPAVGGVACLALAVFQAVKVPSAGEITALWLALGGMLYYSLFSTRAEAVDAYSQAADPGLVRLRGRSPLVLVPVANPESAPAMVQVAAALAPPSFGRVLLLSVLRRSDRISSVGEPQPFALGQEISRAIGASFEAGHEPETLITVADDPWAEIARVASEHRCESLFLGLSRLHDTGSGDVLQAAALERLLNKVRMDVAILRAPPGFRPTEARRILVPIGGKSEHDILRARLLGGLCRGTDREVVFLRVLPSGSSEERLARSRSELQGFAEEEAPPATASAEIEVADDVVEGVVRRAAEADIVILGL